MPNFVKLWWVDFKLLSFVYIAYKSHQKKPSDFAPQLRMFKTGARTKIMRNVKGGKNRMNFYWQIVGIFLSLSLHCFFKSFFSAYSAMSKMLPCTLRGSRISRGNELMTIFAMRTKYNFDVILLTSILTFVFIFPLP